MRYAIFQMMRMALHAGVEAGFTKRYNEVNKMRKA